MKIAELQPGDVLFTMNGEKAPALHTQLYSGDSHFPETLLHAVDGGKVSKVMPTSLKTDGMRVYRCRNKPDLVRKAVEFAGKWAAYETPYDNDRRTVKEAYRSAIPENTSIVGLMQELFLRHGKFRAIKYTARRDEILCYPHEEGGSRGLTCTMFVILCYQAAGLSDHVAKTGSFYLKPARVSDKKMNVEELKILDQMAKTPQLNDKDLEEYKVYVANLQSDNEYKIDWDNSVRRPAPARTSRESKGLSLHPFNIMLVQDVRAYQCLQFRGCDHEGFHGGCQNRYVGATAPVHRRRQSRMGR